MIQLLLVAISCLLLTPSIAYANPRIFNPTMMLGGMFFLFILEGVVLGLLVGLKKVRPLAFLSIWFLVTMLTWILFYLGVSYFSEKTSNIIASIAGEIVVVVIEAYILKMLTSSPKFVRERMALSTTKSIFYSFLANAASLIGGIGVVFLSTNEHVNYYLYKVLFAH